MNWKLRLQNKTVLASIIAVVVAAVYQVLSIMQITPSISEDAITQVVSIILTFLAAMGVLVDPTTQGLSDSIQALSYEQPKKDEQEVKCDRITEDRKGE